MTPSPASMPTAVPERAGLHVMVQSEGTREFLSVQEPVRDFDYERCVDEMYAYDRR